MCDSCPRETEPTIDVQVAIDSRRTVAQSIPTLATLRVRRFTLHMLHVKEGGLLNM